MTAASASNHGSFHIAIPSVGSTKIYVGCLEIIRDVIVGREKSFTIYTASQVGFTDEMCWEYIRCEECCEEFEEESEEVRFFNEDEIAFDASNAEKIKEYDVIIWRYHQKVAERKSTPCSN